MLAKKACPEFGGGPRPDGAAFDGQDESGLKHGDGVWRGIHGDSYVGEWNMNTIDGEGKYRWNDGG